MCIRDRDKFDQILSYGIDMIFCNDDEANAFADTENLDDAIKFFKEQSYIIAITKGAEGSVVINNGQNMISSDCKY